MFITRLALVTVLSLTVAACGSTKTERALSGGAIGAGIGAAGSSVAGGNPWGGAAIGGAAGAATGYLTDKEDIDLGEWGWD